MKQYEYKFVEIKREIGMKVKRGETFEKCKQVITEEAQQGWRLKQIVAPFDEKSSAYYAYAYQIIFEREI